MNIGDKVRFLNAVGGGIVKAFKGKDLVLVEDEDGFDIPVLMRECVVIEPTNEHQVRKTVQPTDTVITQTKAPEPERIEIEETKTGNRITVCLAYLPIDIKSLSTTAYECYLVNDSNYYIAFNYMNKGKDGWTSIANGLVEPNTKIFLEEFEKADLNDRERVCLQFISYKKDKIFDIKNPCSVELRIDTVKFYKLHSFKENDYFDDEAILYYAMRNDLPEREFIVSAEKLESAMREKAIENRRTTQPATKQTGKEIIEVDLHIEELLDNINGLSNKDILDYQLKTFDEVMSENKGKKGQKIVFIHGKGDGVLKSAILKELKDKYKNAFYQDASFKEYGFGATMVTIKR